jgi:phage-related protein
MGVTRQEAKELEVSYDVLSQALSKASEEGGKYYGAMEQQSTTMAGASSNLKESWQVLAGTLSEGLFNAIKDIIPKLTSLFDWLSQNKTIVLAIMIPLLTMINVLGGFFIIMKIVGMFQALWAVLLANPIVAIVTLIAGLVAGFIYLWNNCEAFRQFWINLWENIKIAFNGAIDWIKNALNQAIVFIQGIPALISGIVSSIITFIGKIPYYLGYVIGYISGKLFIFLTDTIPNAIINFFVFLGSIPGKIWDLIVAIFELLGKIPDYLYDLWFKIKAWFINFKDKAIKGFRNLIDNIVSFFKELPDKMWEIGKNVVEGLWNGIKNMGSWIKNKVFDFFKGIVDGAKDALGIHSPSKEFKILGKFSVLGYTEALDDMQNEVDTAIQDTFGISPQLQNASSLHYSPNVVVNNDINVSQDPLGQMVSNIKSFSGGAKNDYSFGLGE